MHSILIIGAGAAGLAAARDLSRAGREVIVLEARDRIGGRIFTHKDPWSVIPIELGAEFVHGKSPELLQIVEEARLTLCDVTERHWYFEDGKLSKSGDFWTKVESLMDEMKASKSDRSFKDFLDSLPDDKETNRAKAMTTRYVQGFHAGNIERIGIHGLIKANEAAAEIDGDKSFRILNGYQSVVQSLREEAEQHGAIVHLKTIVKEIRWKGGEVEAICEGAGSADILSASTQRISLIASAAIVTVPLGILQASPQQPGAVRFVPDLPEAIQAAINGLAMGDAAKITLRFRERFWEELDFSHAGEKQDLFDLGFINYPEAPFPTWWTQLPIRAPILVGWVGGPETEGRRQEAGGGDRVSSPTVREGLSVPPALAGGSLRTSQIMREGVGTDGSKQEAVGSERDTTEAVDSFILNQAIVSLARILNISTDEVLDHLAASYIHDWHHDPFSRGAYSYVPVNGLEAQRVLAQPIDDTLFFAGEATAVGHIGTVHGAIQSGQQAAKQILALSRE